VSKNYQNQEIETSHPAVPERVSVALAELAGEVREGLLALAVGAGLQVLAAMMEDDVTAACGPRGKHDPQRAAARHGRGAGSVALGGRRVSIQRPRMRAVDGSGELPVASYELFSSTEVLGRMALERMLAGLSTRCYPVGLEPVGTRAEQTAMSTSRSAVSRRFVAATETALAQLLAADLSGLDLVALMVDGVHFGEHTCVVALGIDIDGTKHPLALVEGSTENATLVTELIVGLRERGLDVTEPILAVVDGSKALRRAVLDVFDRPVIGRCQLHKIRNVEDRLPDKLRSVVAARMRRAYHAESALAAEAELCALAAELDNTHPGAAASLREGMAETLTVLRLGVPPTLARTLRSTNAIESMISICRTHARNVKRWRDGQMALRWCAAGMVEAGKQFRRVNGHLHLRSLRDTLEKVTKTVGATAHDDAVNAPDDHEPPPKFHGTGHPHGISKPSPRKPEPETQTPNPKPQTPNPKRGPERTPAGKPNPKRKTKARKTKRETRDARDPRPDPRKRLAPQAPRPLAPLPAWPAPACRPSAPRRGAHSSRRASSVG
jgi:putative transposase